MAKRSRDSPAAVRGRPRLQNLVAVVLPNLPPPAAAGSRSATPGETLRKSEAGEPQLPGRTPVTGGHTGAGSACCCRRMSRTVSRRGEWRSMAAATARSPAAAGGSPSGPPFLIGLARVLRELGPCLRPHRGQPPLEKSRRLGHGPVLGRAADATIATSDSAVGTDPVAELSAAGSNSQSVDLTAPSTSGTYYYGACVDDGST